MGVLIFCDRSCMSHGPSTRTYVC